MCRLGYPERRDGAAFSWFSCLGVDSVHHYDKAFLITRQMFFACVLIFVAVAELKRLHICVPPMPAAPRRRSVLRLMEESPPPGERVPAEACADIEADALSI